MEKVGNRQPALTAPYPLLLPMPPMAARSRLGSGPQATLPSADCCSAKTPLKPSTTRGAASWRTVRAPNGLLNS